MLGGFKCSRNSLLILNIFYFIVGVILIGLGGHWLTSNRVSSLPIIGGVVACGVFLSILSVVGLIGAAKHHQVLLFFYMVILLIVFLIQFSIACACLTVSETNQLELARQGWKNVDNATKQDAQSNFKCCGFATYNNTSEEPGMGHPTCSKISECACNDRETKIDVCCGSDGDGCGCPLCEERLAEITGKAFSVTGGVSLFFSFTEIIGAILAGHYRNLYGGV